MGLFDKLFKRNEGNGNEVERSEVEPLSDTSVTAKFWDVEKNAERLANILESSYKDFLMTVTDSIANCETATDLYSILDIAKKVEAEIVADKDPESQKRLKEYREFVTSPSGKKDFEKKLKALDKYQYSLLSEVYTKYCLPEIRQQIAKEMVAASGAADISDKQQKLDAFATHFCKDRENYSRYAYKLYRCPDSYADKIYGELCFAATLADRRDGSAYYWSREQYYTQKGEAYSDIPQHKINMFNQNGLAAMSKELGIMDKNEVRNALINKYIEKDPTTLARVTERTINGQYPSLSLKELKDAISVTKGMSNKEFFSLVYNSDPYFDFNFNDFKTGSYSNMFGLADGMLNDTPENNARKSAWKELGISLDETVATMVLVNGEKYVDTYFEKANEDMDHMHEDSVQKPSVFKRFFAKNMNAMSVDAFRQNYSGLVSAINEVVKSDPAKYEPMLAAMKEKAMDKIKDVYEKQGLKDYLKNKDPWNSLHPTSLSTIVNDDTYIAYERDKKNTPTFYIFGAVDKKTLKEINEVVADRLKEKGATEGKEYHIVISDGKAEDSAYKANLGNPKSLSAITPSDENKETRQWIQPIVKYKVDNGYEKYPSKPKTQERESTRREKSLQRDSRSR